MIDHVQKWERFSQDINTDNIIEAQTGQEALRTRVFSKTGPQIWWNHSFADNMQTN